MRKSLPLLVFLFLAVLGALWFARERPERGISAPSSDPEAAATDQPATLPAAIDLQGSDLEGEGAAEAADLGWIAEGSYEASFHSGQEREVDQIEERPGETVVCDLTD